MNREALADRIVTYSDAIVAFSIVNGLAFVIALGEPDIRCSIGEISRFMVTLNLFFPVASTLALVWLRRFELRLRGGESGDELVARFWRIAGVARIVLLWLFAGVTVAGVTAASFDSTCATGLS